MRRSARTPCASRPSRRAHSPTEMSPRAETRRGARRSSGAHRARDLPIRITLLLGVALVVELFAFAECHRHLRDAAFEVELERNQGQPLSLDRTYQTPDLPLVQQEFAR